jgi:hypothetical protein
MIVIGFFGLVVGMQEAENLWETLVLRVQFEDESLQRYNGCYKNDMRGGGFDRAKRDFYISDDNINGSSRFGFCVQQRQWYLYEGNDEMDPCDAKPIVQSADTDFFDIYTSFLDDWFTDEGTPAEMHFFKTINDESELYCDAFVNDGVCSDVWNIRFRDFDGGDCCAPTCMNTNCGEKGLENPFNSYSITDGHGFPDCLDDRFVPMTIELNKFTNSKDLLELNNDNLTFIEIYRPDFWEWHPKPSLLTLYCDGIMIMRVYVESSMVNQTEKVMVSDAAVCDIQIENSIVTVPGFTGLRYPYWLVDYTVYSGDASSPILVEGSSAGNGYASFEMIPKCDLEQLSDHISTDTNLHTLSNPSSKAIDWMLKRKDTRESTLSRLQHMFSDDENRFHCRENLIELYALSVLNFAAPGSQKRLWIEEGRLCTWQSITCTSLDGVVEYLSLDLPRLGLSGSIASEIGLLSNLMTFNAGTLLRLFIKRDVCHR